jgi:hypothetical protein
MILRYSNKIDPPVACSFAKAIDQSHNTEYFLNVRPKSPRKQSFLFLLQFPLKGVTACPSNEVTPD